MKKKYWFIIIASLLLLLIGTTSLSLKKTGERPTNEYPLTKELRQRIANETQGLDEAGMVQYSLRLTDELLDFSEVNNINNGKANCVGYALLCSSICNYGLSVNQLEGRCKPVVGYVTCGGINMCSALKWIVSKKYTSFVKDHDFVEYDLKSMVIYFDPTLHDLINYNAMTSAK